MQLLTSYIVESINGIETVKAYNAENKAVFLDRDKVCALLRVFFD